MTVQYGPITRVSFWIGFTYEEHRGHVCSILLPENLNDILFTIIYLTYI